MAKKFHELDLSNAFLFAVAMQDSETCRMVLEIILRQQVSKVRVQVEHSILYSTDFRSVCLDVYASDEMQVEYDIEMQNNKTGHIAKRSRYYQSQIDVASLKPGEQPEDLRPNYIIFICAFDPFDRGLYRYTFENRCLECDFPLEDGAVKIFLNTKGENNAEVPEVLVNFLHYLENSTDICTESLKDQTIDRLHAKITAIKESREWEGRYMTFEELLQQRERSGREEGREVMLQLIRFMTEDGALEQIPRLTTDPLFIRRCMRNILYHKVNQFLSFYVWLRNSSQRHKIQIT